MASKWITVLNILLFLIILVASLNLPDGGDDDDGDRKFVGEADDYDRKLNDNISLKHLSFYFYSFKQQHENASIQQLFSTAQGFVRDSTSCENAMADSDNV